MGKDIVKELTQDITREMRSPQAREFTKKRQRVSKVLKKLTIEEIKLIDEIYTELSKESMGNTWDKIDTALYKILRELHISDKRINKAYKMLVDEIGGIENVHISIQE